MENFKSTEALLSWIVDFFRSKIGQFRNFERRHVAPFNASRSMSKWSCVRSYKNVVAAKNIDALVEKMRKCAEGLTENSFSELVPLLDAVELAGLSSGRGQLFCAEVHAGGLF